VLDGEVLGKPEGDADAAAMLSRLAGRTHEVVTGFAAIVAGERRVEQGIAVTEVTLRPLTGIEIAEYVATGEPHDKAGAHAFQGYGRRLVSQVEGLKSNVIGLPLAPVVTAHTALGVARTLPAG